MEMACRHSLVIIWFIIMIYFAAVNEIILPLSMQAMCFFANWLRELDRKLANITLKAKRMSAKASEIKHRA